MDRIQLKLDSRADLRNRLWVALVPLIMLFIISLIMSAFDSIPRAFERGSSGYGIFTAISTILSIVYAIITMPLMVGLSKFYLSFIKGKDETWTTIFSPFKDSNAFLQQVIASIFIWLLTCLGFVLLIIPGIYISLRYSQTPYIFAENDKVGWREAMHRSWEMMDGHVWEKFCLYFSFFWWYCLCAITFGIASIYVAPYINCAMARYYKSVCYAYEDAFGKDERFYSDGQNPNGVGTLGGVQHHDKHNDITEESFSEVKGQTPFDDTDNDER